jgi:hypothetical protein
MEVGFEVTAVESHGESPYGRTGSACGLHQQPSEP